MGNGSESPWKVTHKSASPMYTVVNSNRPFLKQSSRWGLTAQVVLWSLCILWDVWVHTQHMWIYSAPLMLYKEMEVNRQIGGQWQEPSSLSSQEEHLKQFRWGWRHGAGIKNTGYSSRGPEFNTQHQRVAQSHLQLHFQRIQVPLLASSSIRHVFGAQTCLQTKYAYTDTTSCSWSLHLW